MTNELENKEEMGCTISRRNFIKHSSMAVIGVYVLGCDTSSSKQALGFLLLDMKKCQGCISCMLACSLAHEGVENLSLSRIQVLQNPYGKWPNDITIGGTVEGKIQTSKRIHIESTARVQGSLNTPRLSIEEGAVFNGDTAMGKESEQVAGANTALDSTETVDKKPLKKA